MSKFAMLAISSIACLSSFALGSEKRPGLTGANTIASASNGFRPTPPNVTAKNSIHNSLKNLDYIVKKLNIEQAVSGPLPKDLSQHDPKPATPEQKEAYLQKNKKEMLMASFLGINFEEIVNINGEITAIQSTRVSTPLIPDIKIDPQTKKIMSEIYDSEEFNKLKKQRIEWIEKKFGPEIGPEIIRDFIKFDEQQIKKFLESDGAKSYSDGIKEGPDKKGVSNQQVCQKEIENSLDSSNIVRKPLTSIRLISKEAKKMSAQSNQKSIEL